MIISSGKACATTTSTTVTAAIATTTPEASAPKTTAPIVAATTTVSQKTYISHSVTIMQDFGSQTEADLMNSVGFQRSLKESLVAGLVAVSSEFSSLSVDSIVIRALTLTPVRRLGAAGS